MPLFDKASTLFTKAMQDGISESDMDMIIAWPQEELSILFACADQVRRQYFDDSVDPCSIMNIKSGGCSEDCAFCAQSGHNDSQVQIRDLATADEINAQFENARKNNLPFCVVSSGRKLSKIEIKIVTDALKECNGEKHASLGILDDGEFKMLRDAGVSCYNHNIETSRSYFPEIVTTHTWDERVETIKRAKKAGLHVCCGGILGLGESWAQRKEFCLQIRELDIDSVPLNFLNPIAGTRVAAPKDSALDFLKIVSLFRLAMPKRTIKVCGGRELHLGQLQGLMFFAGANGYISGGYLTTSGAGVNTDDILINSLGLNKRIK
jgi:biotin synthase